ncbi:hypothetical protein E2320_006410 [Naja naja]|nr:hypothetical protein E2320_006410 [Naja naja]
MLKHDLRHLLSVCRWVHRRFGQQHRPLLGSYFESMPVDVSPDLLHVIPRSHYPMLHWVFKRQDPSLGLGFFADITCSLNRAKHDRPTPSVDNIWPVFSVVSSHHPHLFEGAQGGDDRRPNPRREPPVWGSDDLDGDALGGFCFKAFEHPFIQTWEERGASRDQHVGIQHITDGGVAFLDAVGDELVEALALVVDVAWGEQDLWGQVEGIPNLDPVAIRKLVFFGELFGGLGLSVVGIQGHETQLDLDVFHHGVGFREVPEVLPVFQKKFPQELGNISAPQAQLEDGMGEAVSLVHRDSMADPEPTIDDNPRVTCGSIEGKDGLDGEIESRDLEIFKHHLGYLGSVLFWVQGRFRHQQRSLEGLHPQPFVVDVLPDGLHLVPGSDDSRFDGVGQREDVLSMLGFKSHVAFFLFSLGKRQLASGVTKDGGHDVPWANFSRNPRFAKPRAIVNDHSLGT